MTVDELVNRIDDRRVAVVDCRWYLGEPDRGPMAFASGHIPGAAYADLDTDLSGSEGPGRHPLPSPVEFDITLGKLGIDERSTVVAYDDRGGAVAARLWWMLTDQGHADTFVLDGGIQAWVEAGGTLSTDVTNSRGHAPRIAGKPWKHVVTIEEVAARSAGTVLIDARSPDRYRGESEPVDPRAGHIPGAVNLPLTDHLSGVHFNQPEVIASRFSEAGVSAGTDVIAQCGSGVTACHVVLAAEIAGLPRPRLYVGSWSEWSGTDRRAAIGSDPG